MATATLTGVRTGNIRGLEVYVGVGNIATVGDSIEAPSTNVVAVIGNYADQTGVSELRFEFTSGDATVTVWGDTGLDFSFVIWYVGS